MTSAFKINLSKLKYMYVNHFFSVHEVPLKIPICNFSYAQAFAISLYSSNAGTLEITCDILSANCRKKEQVENTDV
jgi:hypothetical protein